MEPHGYVHLTKEEYAILKLIQKASPNLKTEALAYRIIAARQTFPIGWLADYTQERERLLEHAEPVNA